MAGTGGGDKVKKLCNHLKMYPQAGECVNFASLQSFTDGLAMSIPCPLYKPMAPQSITILFCSSTKKRWQEYTEELYRKDVHNPDNHDGVITDLEPDILECEVKWALESITMNKASGGDRIPVELFQILKMML